MTRASHGTQQQVNRFAVALRQVVFLFALGTLLSSLAVIQTASPARAYEPPCYDYGCNYLDPTSSGTGCDSFNSVNVDNVLDNTYGYAVDLYWDSFCGSNWALGRNEGCDSYGNCIDSYEFESYKNGTTLRTEDWRNDPVAYEVNYSYMLSGATSSDRVCEEENWNVCTVWH